MPVLAHLSDLHLGASLRIDVVAGQIVECLERHLVDHVVVTGDVTHSGSRAEYDRFKALFAPLLEADRVTVVPGNHDCGGDDIASELLPDGLRVHGRALRGLYLVSIDSTAPHNRFASFFSHGEVCAHVLECLNRALGRAPRGDLCAILLHHHPVQLPEESFVERFATFMGWPNASELTLGEDLLRLALGRCDLVLHGHRHVPREHQIAAQSPRPLGIFNAGSSTALGRFRVFRHEAGRLLGPPEWRAAWPEAAPASARASARLEFRERG
jgi:3',5'-cyclic AMP phosphodiesterase CpdA